MHRDFSASSSAHKYLVFRQDIQIVLLILDARAPQLGASRRIKRNEEPARLSAFAVPRRLLQPFWGTCLVTNMYKSLVYACIYMF